MRCLFAEADQAQWKGNERVGVAKGMRCFVADTDCILKGNCFLTQYVVQMLPSQDLAMLKIARSLLRSLAYMIDLFLALSV